jgi:hypothetical protein
VPDKSGYIVSSKFRIGLFYAYLIAIGVLAFFVARVVLDNARIARESHRALCTLKVERATRVRQSQDILDRPNEPNNALIIRSLGRPLIVRSLHTAKADARALKDVSC